jgi:hypothetical protein
MTRVTRSICALLGVIPLLTSQVAVAGSAFNTSREELDKQSRAAGEHLQDGLALCHEMLGALEVRNTDEAEKLRHEALEKLDDALNELRAIQELAPKQELLLSPRNELDKEVLDLLHQRLEARKTEFPRTERDLADLAVNAVRGFRAILVDTKLRGETDDLPAMYKLIMENTFVEQVGIMDSIVWDMQRR